MSVEAQTLITPELEAKLIAAEEDAFIKDTIEPPAGSKARGPRPTPTRPSARKLKRKRATAARRLNR